MIVATRAHDFENIDALAERVANPVNMNRKSPSSPDLSSRPKIDVSLRKQKRRNRHKDKLRKIASRARWIFLASRTRSIVNFFPLLCFIFVRTVCPSTAVAHHSSEFGGLGVVVVVVVSHFATPSEFDFGRGRG